jgi:hypothetical protein
LAKNSWGISKYKTIIPYAEEKFHLITCPPDTIGIICCAL